MLSGHSDEVRSIFARIKSREFVKSIRILDPSGKVLNSADQDEIGKQIPDLGQRNLPARNLSVFPESGVFVSYARILNAPQCYKCHAPSQEMLGLLEIKLSLDYMTSFISREMKLVM